MTHETSVISNPKIPKDCEITYHELRGYDSPDRWYEAHHRGGRLGSYGTFTEALDACIWLPQRCSETTDRNYIARHAARLMMEALWLAAHDHIPLHDALVLVGLEEA